MKKRTSITISCMLILCLCFGTSCVYATPLSELQDQIQEKQEELKEGKKTTTLKMKNPCYITTQPVYEIKPEKNTYINDMRL